MTSRQYVISGAGGALKSFPLSAISAEAWRAMTSAFASDDDLMKRYDDTAWFRRAVDVRAEALANLPWCFAHDNGDELPEGELPPLPFTLDMDDFLNSVEAWLTLYGAAYAFKGLNAVGATRELRLMHPATIKPQFDARLGLTGFKRTVGGQEQTLAIEDVAYFWLPPRKSDVGPGAAPAKAALAAAGLLRTADSFAELTFENGVFAPVIIEVPEGTPTPEKDRLESWFKRATSGIKKAFTSLAVSAALKIHNLGLPVPLGSLALPELTDKKREDIATALGVPQTLLFSNAANYATAQQDDLHFYDKTIVPEARRIERVLNRMVFNALGWTLRFKPESLECYQQLEALKADGLMKLYSGGVLTRDEVRDEMGREPLPDEAFKDTQRAALAAQVAQLRSGGIPPTPTVSDRSEAVAEPKALPDPVSADLGRWQRKALKRIEEGQPDKARQFESDVLSERVKAYIVGALDGVTDGDGVRQVFTLAENWMNYP